MLGWGGYWGWDPVENASLLPWLTITAFLHSVMMQEKRGMMKMWNMWLIFTTFLLAIFGTFLTRSGVVSSVHAFAQSRHRHLVRVVPGAHRSPPACSSSCATASTLKSEHRLESLVSRESSFLFNNLVLLVACFAVLWGTLFPVLIEWVTGTRSRWGRRSSIAVNIPIGLFLLLLTGVGPLLAWRKTSLDSLKRNFLWPAALALADGDRALIAGGMKPWEDVSLLLLADGDHAFGAGGGDRGRRVLARRAGHCAPDRTPTSSKAW